MSVVAVPPSLIQLAKAGVGSVLLDIAREKFETVYKCSECAKVCTTNGLQPTLLEAGVEAFGANVPRIRYCESGAL
jgi:hypothetical protein